MLTIITNHYLPEITPINNLCIIHFENLCICSEYENTGAREPKLP